MLNRNLLEQFVKERLLLYFGEEQRNHYIPEKDYLVIQRKIELYNKRNISLLKAYGNLDVKDYWCENDITYVNYILHSRYFLKQKEIYFEEEQQERQLAIKNDQILYDIEIPIAKEEFVDIELDELDDIVIENEGTERNYQYNRFNAIKYAETWWDGHNTEYPLYANDCTNFISQCLRAGGKKMVGMPKLGSGWWYKNYTSSSYSWRVSHALRKYLPNSPTGIKAIEVAHQTELSLGDIIIYDFEGDGVWNHCTIVVAKDQNGEPLVNAHTQNSRKRYWSYYDSSAFTENIKYKFFHIIDNL